MSRHLPLITLAAALCIASSAHAQVVVKDAWVRATVPSQKSTGAFMQLRAEKSSRLVAVSSPVAHSSEVHEMTMTNNVMSMRKVPYIELPAGKAVDLKSGGYHIMMMDLKRQVKVGEVVPFTLVIEGPDGKRENVEVKAVARPLGANPDHNH